MTSSSYLYETPLTRMLLGESFHPGGVALTHQLAIQTLVDRDSTVLDIAAGECRSANYIADRFAATTYAVEIDLPNLRNGKAKNFGENASKVHFIQGDAEHLPIANDSIDVVFCECAMSSFLHRDKVLTEIYRVLKPRGFIAISDVFLNQSLPIELNIEINRWLYVGGAYNAIRCQEVVSQSGFYQVRFRDVSSQLLEAVHTIESRLTVPDREVAKIINHQVTKLQPQWKETVPSLLAQFIYDGGAGYYTLTARKPG